ncbi:hypothetical protein [Bosea sp. TAF32]|uniref:hypothetical protein n=1 Tax=Bosea sp. TAF32 TaxID=3237482 RepID=UPI003F8F35B9
MSLPQNGMSLRDWFAATYSLGADGLSVTWAEKVMGTKAPDWTTHDGAICILWWCEAEARVRYLHADAMLKAREGR